MGSEGSACAPEKACAEHACGALPRSPDDTSDDSDGYHVSEAVERLTFVATSCEIRRPGLRVLGPADSGFHASDWATSSLHHSFCSERLLFAVMTHAVVAESRSVLVNRSKVLSASLFMQPNQQTMSRDSELRSFQSFFYRVVRPCSHRVWAVIDVQTHKKQSLAIQTFYQSLIQAA